MESGIFRRKEKMQTSSSCFCGQNKSAQDCCLKSGMIASLNSSCFRVPNVKCLFDIVTNCKNKPIDSHSIPETQLKKIAKSKQNQKDQKKLIHVFRNSGKIFLEKDKKQVFLRETTTAKAGIFSGFCANHDSEIFQSIDQETFSENQKNIFLTSFRSTCYTIITNEEAYHTRINFFKKAADLYEQIDKNVLYEQHKINENEIKQELPNLKKYFHALKYNNYNEVEHISIYLENQSWLLCSDTGKLEYDLNLQSLNSSSFEEICCSIQTTKQGSILIFSHLNNNNNDLFQKFIKSILRRKRDANLDSLLLRYIFLHFQNIAFQIDIFSEEQMETVVALLSNNEPIQNKIDQTSMNFPRLRISKIQYKLINQDKVVIVNIMKSNKYRKRYINRTKTKLIKKLLKKNLHQTI